MNGGTASGHQRLDVGKLTDAELGRQGDDGACTASLPETMRQPGQADKDYSASPWTTTSLFTIVPEVCAWSPPAPSSSASTAPPGQSRPPDTHLDHLMVGIERNRKILAATWQCFGGIENRETVWWAMFIDMKWERQHLRIYEFVPHPAQIVISTTDSQPTVSSARPWDRVTPHRCSCYKIFSGLAT